MEPKFRFEIGEMVIFKVGIEQCRLLAECGEAQSPIVCMVVERMTQECPGGVQIHYAISGLKDVCIKANEIELAKLSDYDPKLSFARATAVRSEIRKAERAEWAKDKE